MSYKQVRTPNPGVSCLPGYCLKYVQDTFGIPAREPSALADWNANTLNHPGQQPPAGVAVPVWFSGKSGALKQFGHVALHMGDGSVWSASHPTSHTPMHFSSIAEMNNYYSGALVYLGWSEDVEEVRVVEPVKAVKEEGMTPAQAADRALGVAYKSIRKLSEGNIIFETTVDGNVWDLASVVGDGKATSAAKFKKGDLFVCQYYADLVHGGRKMRYYVAEQDILAGQLKGINRLDVKIVKEYK